MSHEERWEKAKRDAEQAMKDLGLEDEPRPGDDQAKTSAVEATGAGGRDTARSEADSSRGKEEGAPADAPPATHGERKDEPRPGGGSRYTYTHDVPQPLPHRNTTRSLRVSSEAKAKSFEYWIEDRDGNEHHGPFETYEEAAKNCRITKGEKIVNRDIPRSETAPACLAPDVECKAEPKWSGRCGEHYWRMVAGQEPGHPPPRLPNDLAADPGMWTCKCGRRQKDCPCFSAGAEAGHAVGVKVGSEERGRPTATPAIPGYVSAEAFDLLQKAYDDLRRERAQPRRCGNAGCDECYGTSSRECETLAKRRGQ
jgi:hypothetical protein